MTNRTIRSSVVMMDYDADGYIYFVLVEQGGKLVRFSQKWDVFKLSRVWDQMSKYVNKAGDFVFDEFDNLIVMKDIEA